MFVSVCEHVHGCISQHFIGSDIRALFLCREERQLCRKTKWPLLTPSCHPSTGMTLWPEAAKDLQSENIFLYFIVPQNGNKKAVTVISSGAKCLISHAGRTSSHLKTPVVCIYSLPKSSLMAQSKQRKGMKTERKQTMRQSK